ncbi:MAG: VCBS repeat-containing protein [Candidatus Kapabacteria bacterium]|nr:VCBS repeat-containing protein [Candidatus Kapabacteria bacterium]
MARHNSRPLLMRQTTTRTQGAFLISILLALVALTHTALAQEPTPPVTQSVPTLKEWWRADNMGYGLNGATWIDNFYNGKGALVVSTPNGVQTWQLRYPWDTVNIFTWAGGNANLKTGDFNGDGVKDFIDADGKIYKGVQNGFPVLTKISTSHPDAIGDFNGDGKDDVFSFRASFWYKEAIGHVQFGNDLNDTSLRAVTIEREQPFDTLWSTLTCYTRPDGGLGVIMCGRPYYDSKGNATWMRDGYKLYSVNFAAGSSVPLVAALDSLMIVNNGKQMVKENSCVYHDNYITYFISNEIINGEYYNNNITLYRIINNSISRITSLRKDFTGSVLVLQHSINSDSIPDIVISSNTANNNVQRTFFSGDAGDMIFKELFRLQGYPIGVNNPPIVFSVPDFSGDGINDFVVRAMNDTMAFVYSDYTTHVDQRDTMSGLDVHISPNPMSRAGELVLIVNNFTDVDQQVTVSLIDGAGRQQRLSNEAVKPGKNMLSYPLSLYALSGGRYTICISTSSGVAITHPIIIE